MNKLQVVVEQKFVNFNGAEIMAARINTGNLYVGIKWTCEGLGLSSGQTSNERKKIRKDFVLKQGLRSLRLLTNGGIQEVSVLDINYLPLWLAKISITPAMKTENPELVKRLVEYQLKLKDILAAEFIGN